MMELDFAVLAEAATTTIDGKLNLLGCGYDIFVSPDVPFEVPRVILAMRFLIRPAETNRPYDVEVRLVDGDGRDVFPPIANRVESRPGRLDGALVPLPLVLEMGPLRFLKHGPYSFDVRVEGRVVKSVPLYIVARL